MIPINLAREPFRRDRPILVASAAVGALLLFSLLFLVWLAVSEHRAALQTQSQLDQVDRKLAQIRKEQSRFDAQLRRPDYAIVFDRNIMINDLIRQKTISWTRIFADLSTVLPENVRITAIHPVNAHDQISLDMTVEADASPQIIKFVGNLESSSVFGSTTEVSNFTPPNQNDPYVHYRVSVNYAQKL